MGWRRVLLGALIVSLLLTACALESNWPEVACGPELEVGTVCVPGEAQRAVELFEGVSSEGESASARMTNPLASVLDTNCFTLPETYTVCVSTEAGITVITPVDVPNGARVSFEGDDGLEDIPSVRLDGPLGLRRQNAQFTVLIRDNKDKLLGTLGLGFYP